MPPPRCVLVHSPLTGPSFWSAVRDTLCSRQRRAHLARLPTPEHVHPPYWLTHAAGVAAALPEEDPVILVAHSGAGPLLPAIGRLARNRTPSSAIAGYVFVDSDLPRDGCSRLDLFDDPMDAERLRRPRVGWLPQWSDRQLRDLLPQAHQRERFLEEQPLVPLALYEEIINVPEDWPEAPCAYLELSSHYPTAMREAQRRRWPCRQLNAHHLLPLTDPLAVTEALIELMDQLY